VARIVSLGDVVHFSEAANGNGDRVAAWVARRQLDLITTRQLAAAGITEPMMKTRQRRRTLNRVHQGVYLFGTGAMLPGARELAAVLACGEGAHVRRRSALALLGVIAPWGGDVELAVVGRHCRPRSGVDVHLVARLGEADRTTQNGIPIVSPALALLEFAGVATGDELERAIAEAHALKLMTERQLQATLERNTGMPGAPALRAELKREGGPQWTRSEGERRMKLLLRQAGLPIPLTDERLVGYTADFYWPDHRLIVEVDGYPYHSSRWAFERDRRRDQAHIAAGYRVIRFTFRQLANEPLSVVATIALALASVRGQ
jgi:very-short-patch-repair endonuclease